MTTKQCSLCRENKPLSEFWKHRDRWQAYCKPCKYVKDRAWRKTPAGMAYKARKCKSGKHRSEHLKHRYQIDSAEYDKLHKNVGGACEICSTKPERPLYVDHHHDTGVIRGLLCQHCNSLLGFAKDRVDVLEKAILYLKSFKGLELCK